MAISQIGFGSLAFCPAPERKLRFARTNANGKSDSSDGYQVVSGRVGFVTSGGDSHRLVVVEGLGQYLRKAGSRRSWPWGPGPIAAMTRAGCAGLPNYHAARPDDPTRARKREPACPMKSRLSQLPRRSVELCS